MSRGQDVAVLLLLFFLLELGVTAVRASMCASMLALPALPGGGAPAGHGQQWWQQGRQLARRQRGEQEGGEQRVGGTGSAGEVELQERAGRWKGAWGERSAS